MKPNNLRVRVCPDTGRFWLVEERYRSPIRRVKDITDDVLLGLAADLTAADACERVEREVKFNPPGGEPWAVRIVAELVKGVDPTAPG